MENCKVEKNANYAVLFLSGRIDIIAAEDVEKQVNDIFTEGIANIIFDMKNVIYFSSSGVRLLISARNRTNELDGKLALNNVNSTAEKIMNTLGIMEHYKIFNSLEKSIEYISS